MRKKENGNDNEKREERYIQRQIKREKSEIEEDECKKNNKGID